MTDQGGGIASAFGFRYQYLVTVGILLDLLENAGTTEWAVDVDRAGQDSADIIVYHSVTGPADRVIQVKASLPESSTTIGVKKVRGLLAALANEHPTATTRELVTNRTMTAELKRKRDTYSSTGLSAGERFTPRTETLNDLTSALLQRIGRVRRTGVGGLGVDLHYVLLRQLVDRIHEAGSRRIDQRITRETVRSVLEGPAPVLADTLGARRWGVCIQVPTGRYIERSAVTNFLSHRLPGSAVFDGSPRVAVIHGMSGAGKTSAASRFVYSRVEQVAFVLWLNASSPEALESQLPVVLDQLGTRVPMVDPSAEGFMTLLGELPVPWLLVLDGAQSLDDIDAWVPRSGYGQTLITTSRADWPKDFAPIMRLDEFSRAEAREFFAERLDQPESTWSLEQLTACDEIAHQLSNWPLALELAASWVQRRGTSLEIMQQFAKRLERLDLDDEHLLPHGYPKTAARVIVDLWRELSPPAQSVVSVLLLLGGDRVPERLITDWARNVDLPVNDALEELFAASIIQRHITTEGTPNDYDETITVHDFLKLVVRTLGVELNGATALSVIETCEQSLAVLTEAGRFREGATLVHPVDHLLRELVESMEVNPKMLIRLSVLMHNLAQLAVLTSNVSVARTWFIVAFNVRQADPEHFKRTTVGVQLQLQTLAGAATVMARQYDFEGLKSVAGYACDMVEETDESTFDDPRTLAAIRSIQGSVDLRIPGAMDQLSALVHPGFEDRGARNVSPGSAKVTEFQNEMELAIKLVETDHWQHGVDAALVAANHAQEENLLIDWMVDGLLDVGLILVTAVARRQHNLPEGLLGCLQRVTAWFRENLPNLDELQQQRLVLLEGLATGESLAIRAAVSSLPEQDELRPTVSAWTKLASAVADQLDRFRRYEMFTHLPEAVTIEVGVDGGDGMNFWQEIGASDGTPMLWVCTASRVRYDSRGKTDPVREAFIAAGLPQPSRADKPQPVHGWSATLQGYALTIDDHEGISLFTANGLELEFCERIRGLGGLILAYGDRALVKQEQDSPPLGWVPLVMHDEASSDPPPVVTPSGVAPGHSRGSWWVRLRGWWRRILK